jgi:signal peptidase II
MGNMVDRFIFKGVRDVFFLPFADLGTFNFADVCIIFGSIGFVVSAVTFSLIEIYKEKRKKSISEDFENELDEDENNESAETKKNLETNDQIKPNTSNNSKINEEKPISK